jgi:general secretion pathway protein C
MSMGSVLTPYLTSTWGRRAAFMSMAVAGLLLLNSLYEGISWLASASPAQSAQSASRSGAHKVLPDIASWHLFGSRPPAIAAGQVANLPATTLQLTLSGLFKDTRTQQSKALISAPGHPSKAYGVGDALPSGATVYQILDDGVILERNGHLEKLTLPIQPLKFGSEPSSTINFQQGKP